TSATSPKEALPAPPPRRPEPQEWKRRRRRREGNPYNHDFSMTISMTVIYILITITGVLGNVATCIVIVRNRIMHTATNYYLFSMAISDLLLLAFGMPEEMYLLWWGPPYVFGAEFCFIRGFTAEISTNASILTIAAFTVERYIGICHPLRSHTMSQLGRVIRSIAVIWAVATACAVPIAIQYGIVYMPAPDGKAADPSTATCTIKKRLSWVFEISSLLFFVAPMLLITVLYACIAVQLQRSARIARSVPSIDSHNCSSTNDGSRNKAVIKMLVAVVIAFFVCFAPHQAQRLMAIHADPKSTVAQKLFNVLYNISGISYYISTCVNPILYHIMSNRFRQALQVTLESCCGRHPGAGGGRWYQPTRSQQNHILELTDHTFVSEATTVAAVGGGGSSKGASPHHPAQYPPHPPPPHHHHPSSTAKKTNIIIQELNGLRKGSSGGKRRFLVSSSVVLEVLEVLLGGDGIRPPGDLQIQTPLQALRQSSSSSRQPEVIENPIDTYVAANNSSTTQQGRGSRKRSQSDSLLSGGSISNCSMTHVEQEFTQKELAEVMGRMKNMENNLDV
ncbi:LOW QUALITY PROTEIN: pyrokinin-1 receptor-like, partial [Macrobrachium nipponense]|uniref:LOW QUALITY PROTEIN: pyrokinin-1 receptor-like n=1 Tax=Macrobrachium nipponense TaxID=159736 RepID=UPI0030C8BCF9